MRVPSTTGSSPWWCSQAARRASCWCSRGQAIASAVPYRDVCVRVVTAGSGQVAGLGEPERGPRAGTAGPFAPGSRGGAGKYITRSLRSLPVTSSGRPPSSQASRVRS